MILVTGPNGFVGSRIMKYCKDVIASPSLRSMTEDQVRRMVEESEVDTIIHTAAISGVQTCQRHPEESYIANVLLPVYLAKASKNIKLICFSSDQVYTGTEADVPYTEDMARPNNVYATHKLEMEQRVLDIAPDSVHLRAQWMYDFDMARGDFFMDIYNAQDTLSYSSGQYRCVTYIKEVAENMEKVAKLPGGVYNFGSETTKSMYEVAKETLAVLGKDVKVEDKPAGHSLWVNCEKARKHGVIFSSVEDGLAKCAKDYNLSV